MIRIFIAGITVFAFGQATGQGVIDSLVNELGKDYPDSVKARICITLADEYQFLYPQQSKAYALRALDFANEPGLVRERLEANKNLALYYYISGDYGAALEHDARALELSISLKDSANISIAYNNIGNDYYDLGNYAESYKHFTQSFLISKLIGDSVGISTAYLNVGRIFKAMSQYDRAMAYFQLAMSMSKELGDTEGLPYAYFEMGNVLLAREAYDSAHASFIEALRIIRTNKIPLLEKILEPRILNRIARGYSSNGEYELSLNYYDSAFSIHVQNNNINGMAEVDLGRGLLYYHQNNFTRAQEYVETALSRIEGLHALVLKIKAYKELAKISEGQAKYRESLNYIHYYQQLEDSLFSQEMQAALLADQIRFETQSLGQQIAELTEIDALQQSELKKKSFIQNILVVTFALTAILLLSVYRSGQRRKRIHNLLVEHQNELKRRSAELEQLNQVKDKFFSIISHDLRSPINALAGVLDLLDRGALSQEDMTKHIRELRIRFNYTRTLLNNLLDWTLLQMDKLRIQVTEINLNELASENIQLLTPVQSKSLEILNNIPENASVFADLSTINVVMRNLITNAMKFSNEGGRVELGALDTGKEWHVFVKDDGIGIPEDVQRILFTKTSPYSTRGTANEKGTGLGLILCKEFIEKNGGRIWVESTPGEGSTFWFSLRKYEKELL